ncbi:MAG: hypothetical protein OHK0053_38540 [Microscillaceae bacterium]
MQLILDSPGVKLSRQQLLFEIRYQDERRTVHPDQVQQILLSRGVLLTSDALLLALEQQIDLILLDRRGYPVGRLWNHRFGSIATVRRQQLRFAPSRAAMEWVRDWVLLKIKTQTAFLYQVSYGPPEGPSPDTQKALKAMERIQRQLLRQKVVMPQVFGASLRGWEGTASRHYFENLSQALPPLYRFEARSRRPARDYFNCALNYLYGVLYASVESALLKAGLDPAIGIWHADEYNKPVLSFDFIEPYRVWADQIAFRLCQQYALGPADVVAHQEGLWLAGSGKRTVIQAFNDFLDEVVPWQGRRRSRLTHIQLDAHAFAQKILKWEETRNREQ